MNRDKACSAIKIENHEMPYCSSAKYLGVRLCAKKCLNVDLKSMKTKFYASFNGLFHRVAKMKDNLTVLHLVSTYCKLYLLYGTECFTLNCYEVSQSVSYLANCGVAHF